MASYGYFHKGYLFIDNPASGQSALANTYTNNSLCLTHLLSQLGANSKTWQPPYLAYAPRSLYVRLRPRPRLAARGSLQKTLLNFCAAGDEGSQMLCPIATASDEGSKTGGAGKLEHGPYRPEGIRGWASFEILNYLDSRDPPILSNAAPTCLHTPWWGWAWNC